MPDVLLVIMNRVDEVWRSARRIQRRLGPGRSPLLPAYGQAATATGHRDRGAVQEGAATCLQHTDTEEWATTSWLIRVQPDEGVTLKFGSKVPADDGVRDVSMDSLRRGVHRVLPRGL